MGYLKIWPCDLQGRE